VINNIEGKEDSWVALERYKATMTRIKAAVRFKEINTSKTSGGRGRMIIAMMTNTIKASIKSLDLETVLRILEFLNKFNILSTSVLII
jgi:hypothetical protein